jgi:hypothetical protein
MASNFHIISYKDGDSLYLSLSGDFDGSSAYELINTLTKNGNSSWDIFIDTNNLKTTHSFGRDVFQKNLSGIIKQLKNLIIVGANKYKFEQDFE